jgi:hypothetical protein
LVETPETAPDTPPLRCRRRPWRAHHAAGACLSLVLLALICGFGLVVAVLAIGSLNLDAIKPFVASALQ